MFWRGKLVFSVLIFLWLANLSHAPQPLISYLCYFLWRNFVLNVIINLSRTFVNASFRVDGPVAEDSVIGLD